MAIAAAALAVGYDEFGDWYRDHRIDILEPGLEQATAALHQLLADVLSDRDQVRIRNISGRVKSKRRTWRKLNQHKISPTIATVTDIPEAIYDLIGLRITCTNVRDIDMVQSALETLPRKATKRGVLWLDPDSERDYVIEPKESGYRAWHVNLGLSVDHDSTPVPVICELQVRTLLQDSWGELTHEDTYSKDGALPPLVEVLSKRMADLFSILDDIAEDLRTELDRIDEAAVAETGDPAADAGLDPLVDLAADAAAFLVDRWRKLDRPTPLASLAWSMQRDFGAEVSDGWFGHGGFKRFLRHAVPDAVISTGRQAYLLPPDAETSTVAEEPGENGAVHQSVPGAARQMRRVDRTFPLLEAAQWTELFTHLAEAWRRIGPAAATPKASGQMAQSASDRAKAAGTDLSRRHLGYVAHTVLAANDGTEPLGVEELTRAFTELTLQRMTDLRIIEATPGRAHAAVGRWLGGDGTEPAG